MTNDGRHLTAMGLPSQMPLPEEPSFTASIWAEEIVNLTINILPQTTQQQYAARRSAMGHGPQGWGADNFPMDVAAELLSERFHV